MPIDKNGRNASRRLSRLYQTQQRDRIRQNRPPQPGAFSADLGRFNVQYPGGTVPRGKSNSTGQPNSQSMAVSAGDDVVLYADPALPEPVVKRGAVPQGQQAQAGTPIGFIGLQFNGETTTLALVGVSNGEPVFEVRPFVTGFWFELWVKFGTDEPVRVQRIDDAKLTTAVGFNPVPPASTFRQNPILTGGIRVCSALSPDLVLVSCEIGARELRDDDDKQLQVFYAALYSQSSGLQAEQFVSYRPGLDDSLDQAINWTGQLADYADWLPITMRRALADIPLLEVYDNNDTAVYRENRVADRTAVTLSESVNRLDGDHTSKFLDMITAEGLAVNSLVAGKNPVEIAFTFEQSDLAAMGVNSSHVYGYLVGGFVDELPLSVPALFADPSLSDFGSSAFTSPRSLAFGRDEVSLRALENNHEHFVFNYSQAKVAI